MAKLGQIKSGTMRVGNTTASGYGIVYADEIIGHRRVNTYAELKTLPAWCLYNKAGGDSINTAIGQLWYVYNGDSSHVAGLYQLVNTDISLDSSWKLFKNGADVSTHDTTYTFADGSDGSFTVTPKGGSAQTVSIGKPTTAGTADHAKTADAATKADSAALATNANHATSADSATKATKDANNNNIVDTYATKREISALTSALVYKGTVDAKYALPTKNVKIGDVYVVAATGTFAGQTCEPGDMIIAQTASNAEGTPAPTWTVVQTNINGAVTSTDALADNTLVLGNNNRAIKASSGSGFVKVINGTVSYNNDVVTASDTLDASKLIIGKGKKIIQTASGTGFVKISDGVVLTDNSTYLTSVPTAKDNVVGGFKTGYADTTVNSRNYAVKLDSNNKAYVNVPWTDNNTTYTADGVYVTLDKGQFSLHRNKKALIDNAIQPDNIETEDGILTYDKFGYLYHQITTDLSDKYVCKDLVKSYVSVNIIQHSAPVAGGANMTGALVFCASAPATDKGVYTGKFGQYQTGSTGNIYSNDVTWALDAATDLIVVDQNGNEYTVTSGTGNIVLTPRAIQKSTITSLF